MNQNLGLGRKPSPFDIRDYKLADYISHSSVVRWFERLFKTSATGSKIWLDIEHTLDQGQTGHCVGFGGSQYLNTYPIDDKVNNDYAHALYYKCKVVDGEPNAEDGSTVRTLAKVLQSEGRIKTYAFASTVDEVKHWVLTKGSIVVGTDWLADMFYPSSNGFVSVTGTVAGGHCYLLHGYDHSLDAFKFLNSWGNSWGKGGHFYMSVSDFDYLLSGNGEAMAAVELPR